jgi:hypothetical protein
VDDSSLIVSLHLDAGLCFSDGFYVARKADRR